MRMGLKLLQNQRGSILNIALLMLITLSLIAIYMAMSSSTDVKIARNEKAEKTRFYAADSGIDMAAEIIEQNVACPLGFSANYPVGAEVDRLISGYIFVDNLTLKSNTTIPEPSTVGANAVTAGNRDAYWPLGSAFGDAGSSSVRIGGVTQMAAGAALQMAAGYEGKGKGAASGGGNMLFEIYSQYYGNNGAEALIWIRWRHLLGQEDNCKYY